MERAEPAAEEPLHQRPELLISSVLCPVITRLLYGFKPHEDAPILLTPSGLASLPASQLLIFCLHPHVEAPRMEVPVRAWVSRGGWEAVLLAPRVEESH